MSTTEAPRSERLAQIVPEALAAIHAVLERHRVTEEEWHAVLRFLTDVGRADEFILLSDVTRTSVLIDAMSHDADETATASDVEGPLYVEDPPWREAPVKIYEEYEGCEEGEVLFVRGRVTGTDGTPLPDAVIDIWQTGPTGGYDIWDERQPEFNFRGRFHPAESGAYEFQTMVPKPYTVPTDGPVGRYLAAVGQHPWRPAHIHFKVTADGYQPLITQVFFPDDPYLENDTIGAVKDALVRPLERHDDFATCDFDIRLRPAG
jgi:protocatechuate 3,4-dioxygenase beta subunit